MNSPATELDVLCLRPKADFERVGVVPPSSLRIAYRAPDDSDVPALMKLARALVIPAVGPKISSALFDGTTVRFVQVTGAGLDRLNLGKLKELGITVANVPGGSNTALAEYAVTAASLLLRRFAWSDSEIRAGHYAAFRARMLADNLSGLDELTVGVVGLGAIGMAVAKVFQARGCRICYYDPAPRDPQGALAIGATALPLEELLAKSDVVTLHVPLIPATQNLIGANQFVLMKPSAILIQASRGGVVNEAALADCLRFGHLGGAAVDVYSAEPPAADNPLLALDGEAARKLLLTPHIAGVTGQASTFLFRSAWRNVERVLLANEPPADRVA
jgi:phosphoglycerate dehydrogenase-like enzyme